MSLILAIDPGYDRVGVALIDVATRTVDHSFCIETNKKESHEKRLADIYSALEKVFNEYNPEALALETLFFSLNKTTALKVAEARGVVLLLAGLHKLEVIELSPQEVKLGMTGVGNADKKQMQKMVELTLKIDLSTKLDDEIDAIALGIAAAQTLHIKNLQK